MLGAVFLRAGRRNGWIGRPAVCPLRDFRALFRMRARPVWRRGFLGKIGRDIPWRWLFRRWFGEIFGRWFFRPWLARGWFGENFGRGLLRRRIRLAGSGRDCGVGKRCSRAVRVDHRGLQSPGRPSRGGHYESDLSSKVTGRCSEPDPDPEPARRLAHRHRTRSRISQSLAHRRRGIHAHRRSRRPRGVHGLRRSG